MREPLSGKELLERAGLPTSESPSHDDIARINQESADKDEPEVHECQPIVHDDDVICRDCGEHSETEICMICDEEFGTVCCGAGGRF